MLTYLAIRDFAIVDRLQLEFGPGFSVLTGETGAGKSIVVNAIQLLLGGRASPDMIRTDRESAEVEGVFELASGSRNLLRLEASGLSDGNTLSVRRIISRIGKNRVFVNGRAATLAVLGEVTQGILDISGQHEHVELTNEDTQRVILDDFGGLRELRQSVRRAVEGFRALLKDHQELLAREKQRAEREDYLRFSISRIDEIKPGPAEDEGLEKERSRLRNVGKLADGLGEANGLLYEREGSAVESLGKAKAVLSGLVRFDPDLSTQIDQADTIQRLVGDLSRDLSGAFGRLNSDPKRLEEVEERLSCLRVLTRSYGPTLPDVLEKRAKMQAELDSLGALASRLAEVERERDSAWQQALSLAVELSQLRREAARELSLRLAKELSLLAMPGATVDVRVQTEEPERLNEWGLDRVSFLLSANPGEELRSISRVASGGELSRVLLALKVVLADVDPVPTYVFDEVDSGVGGAVAEVIGLKLLAASDRHQVLCITHLPQIAAQATSHLSVHKRTQGERTVAEVNRLSSEERVEEIARMAGGRRVTDKARGHARELLRKNSRRRKVP